MTDSVSANFGDPITYWLLRFILFFSLLLTGAIISYGKNSKKNYWRICLPVMILYTFVEGLRYMRSWDYPHYMYDLTVDLYSKYSEPIYILWANGFRELGLHFVFGFLFYSAILVFSFFLLLKDFHKAAIWACPLFLVIPNQSTNLIRMFFAMAFFLIGIHYMINGKKKAYVNFAVSCMIHFSVIPVIIFVIILNWKRVGILSNHVFLILIVFFLVALFWDISRLDNLALYLSLMDSTNFEQADVYLNDAENWFGSGGSIQEKYGYKEAGLLMKTLNTCVPAYIILYGYNAYKRCPKLKVLLGSVVFGFFIQKLGGGIELISRYYHWMTCLIPILIGVIWNVVKMKKLERILFLFVIIFYYYIANFAYFLFKQSPTGYGFIWDK